MSGPKPDVKVRLGRIFNELAAIKRARPQDAAMIQQIIAGFQALEVRWFPNQIIPENYVQPVNHRPTLTPAEQGAAAYHAGAAGTDNPFDKATHPVEHDGWIIAFNAEYFKSDKYQQHLTRESNHDQLTHQG